MSEIRYTNAEARWTAQLAAIERSAFPAADISDLFVEEEVSRLCDVFPEGRFVAIDGEEPVGMTI